MQPRTMHEHAEHGRVSIRIATPTRYTDAVSVGIVLGTVRVRGCDRSEDTTGKCWCRRSRCWSEKGHHLRARYASRQPHSNATPHACMICLSCAYSCVLPSTCTCSIGYWRPSRAVFSCDRKRLMGNMSSGGNQAGGTFVCSCMLFKVCLIVLSIRSASDGVLKEAPKPQVTRCCILTHTCAGDLVFMVTLFPLSGHLYGGGATF